MTLPRARAFTLSAFQTRPIFPAAVHRGDSVDVSINWVALLRNGETPNETIAAANVSARDLTVSNISYSGKYLNFTLSGAQADGEALVSMAVATTAGRSISRSLRVRTVWEDAVIDPVPVQCSLVTLENIVDQGINEFWGFSNCDLSGEGHQVALDVNGCDIQVAYGQMYGTDDIRIEISSTVPDGLITVYVLSGEWPDLTIESTQVMENWDGSQTEVFALGGSGNGYYGIAVQGQWADSAGTVTVFPRGLCS